MMLAVALLLLILSALSPAAGGQDKIVAGPVAIKPRPNCPKTCGNVSVPFPFGFESGCYRDADFKLTCNTTNSQPPMLLARASNINFQVKEIRVEEGKLGTVIFNASSDVTGWQIGKFIEWHASQVFVWVVDELSCKEAKRNKSSFACISEHSECNDANFEYLVNHESGYLCKCSEGYAGNPYIQDGCRGFVRPELNLMRIRSYVQDAWSLALHGLQICRWMTPLA